MKNDNVVKDKTKLFLMAKKLKDLATEIDNLSDLRN